MKTLELKALLLNMAGNIPMKQHSSENVDLSNPTVSSKTLPFKELGWTLRQPFYTGVPGLLARQISLWGRPKAQHHFLGLDPVSDAGTGSYIKDSVLILRQ